MRRLAVLAVLLPLLAAAPAEAKVACGDGTTAFVDGKLRIFGIHYRTLDEWGFDEYACLGRRRPLLVGGVGSDNGHRVGGDARLRARGPLPRLLLTRATARAARARRLGRRPDPAPAGLVRERRVLRVDAGDPARHRRHRGGDRAGRGRVRQGAGPARADARRRGRRATSRCTAAPSTGPRAAQPRSAALPGVSRRRGDRARAGAPAPPRRRLRGRARPHDRRLGLRAGLRDAATGASPAAIGRRGRIPLAGSTPPRIVGDRWLLVFGEGSARVLDTRTGRDRDRARGRSSQADAAARRHARLDRLRRAAARRARPGADAVVLSDGARRACSPPRGGRSTGPRTGRPRVYRPPSEARSASKPG